MFYLLWLTFCFFLHSICLLIFYWQRLFASKNLYAKNEIFSFRKIISRQFYILLPHGKQESSIQVVGSLFTLLFAFLIALSVVGIGALFGASFLQPTWLNYYLQSFLILGLLVPMWYFLGRIPQFFSFKNIALLLPTFRRIFFISFSQWMISLYMIAWLLYRSLNGWWLLINVFLYSYFIYWQWKAVLGHYEVNNKQFVQQTASQTEVKTSKK